MIVRLLNMSKCTSLLSRRTFSTKKSNGMKGSLTYILKNGERKNVQASYGTNLLEIAHDNDIDLEGMLLSTCNSRKKPVV